MTFDPDHPFAPLCSLWVSQIKLSKSSKEEFTKAAKEVMKFYSEHHDWLYDQSGERNGGLVVSEGVPAPDFGVSNNKAAELVQLFGPHLYHRNPHRVVKPREIPVPSPEVFAALIPTPPPMQPSPAMMPMQPPVPLGLVIGQVVDQDVKQRKALMQVRSDILSTYLNYTPGELDLKSHSQRGIDEALLKGRGLLWCHTYNYPGSQTKLIGSFYDSIDNLYVDPDATSLENANWIARECVHPVWQVEQEYGLPPGTLKGNLESHASAAKVEAYDGDPERKRGQTCDVICYYKIWSKMGMGDKLKGAPPEFQNQLNQFGPYIYMVVAEGIPYFLNVPNQLLDQPADQGMQMVEQAFQWPTPFWKDDAWPFSELDFHWVPEKAWPMSHLFPAMGELKMMDWVMSFLIGKVRTTSRDFIAYLESLEEEFKKAIEDGGDLTMLPIKTTQGAKKIDELVQFLQHPPMNQDILRVYEMVKNQFEERTGITELMHGFTDSSYRSAAEAQLKGNQTRIRPDDMANKVEDWMGRVARKEAMAARWHLRSQDVAPVLGQGYAKMWDMFIATAPVDEVVQELDYTIESGSVRKPNVDRETQNMNLAMQTVGGQLWQYFINSNNPTPFNALITQWAKANQMDASQFLVQPIMMMPPPGVPPEGGPPQEGQPNQGPPK